MEAPKGIQILAEAGDIQAICRNELRLESKDGEVSPARFSWKLKAAHFLGLGSYRCYRQRRTFLFWTPARLQHLSSQTSPTSSRGQPSHRWLAAVDPPSQKFDKQLFRDPYRLSSPSLSLRSFCPFLLRSSRPRPLLKSSIRPRSARRAWRCSRWAGLIKEFPSPVFSQIGSNQRRINGKGKRSPAFPPKNMS